MTDALSVNEVFISYGKHDVVNGLSLCVREGECFGLIGLNGVGKTTLIKAILGLREYSRGNILVFEQDRLLPGSKNRLAYLPERFDPPWFLNAEEFIRFSLTLYKQPYDAEKVGHLADKLALDRKFLRNRVQTFSKGMRQKLGIMATVLTQCPLLILDEPMSGLDPLARARVKDVLLEANAQGRTVFLSSHILADMDDICDRVGILNQGQIVFTGTPDDLKKQGGMDSVERAFLRIIGQDIAAVA